MGDVYAYVPEREGLFPVCAVSAQEGPGTHTPSPVPCALTSHPIMPYRVGICSTAVDAHCPPSSPKKGAKSRRNYR